MIKNMPKKRIVLVEDHALLSAGIKHLLIHVPGYEIVGEVADGLQAYPTCLELQPDIVLLDLGLPGMDGIDVIYRLKQRWASLLVIVLTADNSEHRARTALGAGASGYILKKSPQQTLLAALKAVSAGQIYIDPDLNQTQIVESADELESVRLTMRERQVLKLIAEGQRNRDIAELLTINIKTVETHRLNLMRKLNVHNVAQLTNLAFRLGIHS
ncbi:two component system response regulator [Klebsiella michiganensis]|jgi:two-component system secretion response regulator SsrB|uniref:two component system response regulator n=1 Tax=Klebsiella michiganensis TaxID=1134687 RepID=UPI002570D16B|nr:two component system response regulator [Klebsiella michiganensis]MDL4454959.1 two component system response regulator [Klebsiella michiganensis]